MKGGAICYFCREVFPSAGEGLGWGHDTRDCAQKTCDDLRTANAELLAALEEIAALKFRADAFLGLDDIAIEIAKTAIAQAKVSP